MALLKKLVIQFCGKKKPCQNFDFKDVNSILIRPFGYALGDAIIHLAYAQQLKAMYPNAHLGILVGRNRDIFSQSPLFDELVENSFTSCLCNRNKWQLILDFCETFNTHDLISNTIINPKAVMIFSKQDKKYYNHSNISNYDFCCPFNANSHVVEHLRTSKFTEYFDVASVKPELSIKPDEVNEAITFWKKNTNNQIDKINILIAPQGSFKAGKYIPAEELADLLNRCDKQFLSHIRFMVCHTINSEKYFERLKCFCHPNIPIFLSPKTQLSQYLALTAAADIVIGVDSGTVHLSCALKKPLLSFYANHNLHLWHPLSHDGIPHLMVIAPSNRTDSKETKNFPLDSAADWLNTQIHEKIKNLQLNN